MAGIPAARELGEAARRRIEREVRAPLRTEILRRALYSTDASHHEIMPLGVIMPRDTADVAALARVCDELGVPLVPRGGGSGLAGESLNRAVMADLTRHFSRVLAIDPSARTVRVQCGVTIDNLNAALAPHGLKFGPDPASGSRCVVGGCVANNATGAHSLRYGYTRDQIVELTCVLANGEVIRTRPVEVGGDEWESIVRRDTLEARLYRRLAPMLREHAALIEEKRPKTTRRHRAGYLLHGVLSPPRDGAPETLDLSRLVCGSEGTLAIVTEAVLRTVPRRKSVGLGMFYFDDATAAAACVREILPHDPYAVELMDETVVRLARESPFGWARYLSSDTAACLIVEFDGADVAEVRAKLERLAAELVERRRLARRVELAIDPTAQAAIWAIRKSNEPLLYRRGGARHPVGFVEDAAVDPHRLDELVTGERAIFARHGVDMATFAHAGAGLLHTKGFLNLKDGNDIARMERIAEEAYDLVLGMGGTISGEHGDGLLRTQFLPRQFGALYPVFAQIKALFDPRGILNPGKIVNDEDPHLMTHHLRFGPGYDATRTQTQLLFAEGELAREAEACNGNGACRTNNRALTMCPLFKDETDEANTPRAKGNIMRQLVAGRIGEEFEQTEEFNTLANLCVNCKACHLECPSEVNIPKMMLEAKTRYVARHGQTLANYFLIFCEEVSRLNCLVAPLANRLARWRPLRRVVEAVVGVDRRRALPTFERRPFLSTVRKSRLADAHEGDGAPRGHVDKIVYFVDLYANYNDHELARAFLAVMARNKVHVALPRQRGCGMPAMDYGSKEIARRIVKENVANLYEWARRGYKIVCTEPTAALTLKEEMAYYSDDPRLRTIERSVFEAMEYCAWLRARGWLALDGLRAVPMRLGYHQPCHHKALKIGLPGVEIARAIPGVEVEMINEGCCGIAGTWGMKRENFERSMEVGSGLFGALAKESIVAGMSECSTCKMQMEQGAADGGAPKPTIHPIKLLAAAYGEAMADLCS